MFRRFPAPIEPTNGVYSELNTPVVLVTQRGREMFDNSHRLFRRLEEIARDHLHTPADTFISAIWQGKKHVSEAGVAALETMLLTVGLANFDRASKAQRGGPRALRSKYQWDFLADYLGWEWEAA